MIPADRFLAALAGLGCRDFAGVPCSYLSGLYDAIGADEDYRYVPAPNEGAALALASGLLLSGRRAAVLLQNSGFGNLLNPLTSLVMPYRMPVLVVMTLRGQHVSGDGEPQHVVMGQRTTALLDTLGLAHHLLPADVAGLSDTMERVDRDLRAGRPVFLLVPKNGIGPASAPRRAPAAASDTAGCSYADALGVLVELFGDALFVTTTGYISRDLFGLADRAENFYLQGAMGHAAALAAGVALGRPERRVVAVDGDGSALMHLGTLAMVGRLGPANLLHVVLDNGVYESTGGQPTPSATTSFPAAAIACGYRSAASFTTLQELRDSTEIRREIWSGPGPVLAHVRATRRTESPGPRASAALPAPVLARRFARAAGAELSGAVPW